MHIDFSRSGGFSGLRLTISIDVEQLAGDEAATVKKLIDQAGFFNLPARLDTGTAGADRFEYKVSITAIDRSHTVVMSESAVPDRVQPLIDHLTSLARTRKSA